MSFSETLDVALLDVKQCCLSEVIRLQQQVSKLQESLKAPRSSLSSKQQPGIGRPVAAQVLGDLDDKCSVHADDWKGIGARVPVPTERASSGVVREAYHSEEEVCSIERGNGEAPLKYAYEHQEPSLWGPSAPNFRTSRRSSVTRSSGRSHRAFSPCRSAPSPTVVASCPEIYHDEVLEICMAASLAKAFGMKGDVCDMLTGDQWVGKWEAKVVLAAVTLARERNSDHVKIICIQGGPHCDSEMASQPRLKQAIKREHGDPNFRVAVEWIEIDEFREKFYGTAYEAVTVVMSRPHEKHQDTVLKLKNQLEHSMPEATFELDLDQRTTAAESASQVESGSHFLLYLERNILQSAHVRAQLRCALDLGKPVILMMDPEVHQEADDISFLLAKCPEDLRCIFQETAAIPWSKDRAAQEVSLDQFRQQLRDTLDGPSLFNRCGTFSIASWINRARDSKNQPILSKSLIRYLVFAGVPFCGQSTAAWIWCYFVKCCTCLAFIATLFRLHLPEGPAFRDYRDFILLPALQALLIIGDIVVRSLVSSELIAKLSERHPGNTLAQSVYGISGKIAWICWLETIFVTVLIHIQLTQSFFSDDYINGSIGYRAIFLGNGIVWIACSIPIAASFVSTFYIFILMAILVRTDLISQLSLLHPQIQELGIERSLRYGIIVHLSDSRFVRFQCGHLEAWLRLQKLYRKFKWFYGAACVFWIMNFALQMFYTTKLVQGVKVHREIVTGIRWSNFYLTTRSLQPLFLDLILLLPFFAARYLSVIRIWSTRLLFTKPESSMAVMIFLKEHNCNMRLGMIQLNAHLLPYVICGVSARCSLWVAEICLLNF